MSQVVVARPATRIIVIIVMLIVVILATVLHMLNPAFTVEHFEDWMIIALAVLIGLIVAW